jgi:Fur family peroxide stress response transcriptional regulator
MMQTKKSNVAVERRVERLEGAARKAGAKLTPQRLEIFRVLSAREDHPDAETVFRAVRRRLPTVSLDTVYRTLWLLHEHGLVATLGPSRDAVRFDANVDPHHHYHCVRCGLVRDFESAALSALRVPDAVHRMGSVVDARVEVLGLCARCQPRRAATKPRPADTSRTPISAPQRRARGPRPSRKTKRSKP